jgi:cytochrome c biogenesis protein ResB
MTNDQSPISNLQSPGLKRAFRFLARLDVAAVLIVVVLLLAGLGSCFPQVSPAVASDPERMARWEAGARARYGGLADELAAGGAFGWFRSPVFLVPLALLAAVTLVCTLERWRGVWRRARYQPVRCSDVALERAPHTASLNAPARGDLAQVVWEALEERGFRVRTTEVVTTNGTTNGTTNETRNGTVNGRVVYLRGDRNRLAPLATLVTHVAVVLLLLGAALTAGFGWREEVTLGPGETAEVGHGSGLALRNEGFAVERYLDGSVAGYEAGVAVVAGGRDAARGSIRVNEPLHYGGVGLLLQAYAETPDGASVTLLAVRDPGYGLAVVAGFLLLFGMTVSFNFPHCCVRARVAPEETVRLAGRADRRACDFRREFAALVEEIRRALGGEGEGTGWCCNR